jgi:hypothetical protein
MKEYLHMMRQTIVYLKGFKKLTIPQKKEKEPEEKLNNNNLNATGNQLVLKEYTFQDFNPIPTNLE